MDILTFIAKMTNSLAWPGAIVIGLWLIKDRLFEFLSSLNFIIQYKEWKLDINKAITDVKNQQDEIQNLIDNLNRKETRKHEP